jgi:hypothetical protein
MVFILSVLMYGYMNKNCNNAEYSLLIKKNKNWIDKQVK